MAGLTTAGVALAACAPPPAPGTSASAEQPDEELVTLRYMGWPFGNWLEVFEDMTVAFHEANPGIVVEFEMGQSTSTREKVAAMAAANTPPDLAMGFFHHLIPEGEILDCNPFIDRDSGEFSWDNYFGFSELQARLDPLNATPDPQGGSYIFPLSLYGATAFYNQTLFDEAGVSYPQDDWTWDQYREAASLLTKDSDGNRPGDSGFDPERIVAYGANHWNWNYMYLQMARERGSDVFTPDSSECAMRDQAWIDTFNWIDAAANEFYAHPGGAMAPTGDSGGVSFAAGTVAIDFGMNWSLASYIRDIEEFEWSMSAMPSQNGNRIPTSINDGIVIFSDSQHQDEAWTFMKFFESEDVSRDFILQEVAPPFKKVCLEEYIPSVAEKNSEALRISLETGRPMPYDRAFDDWQGMMDQALGAFIIRERFDTAEQACDWAATEIDRIRESVWVS